MPTKKTPVKATERINQMQDQLEGWTKEIFIALRTLILSVDPDFIEEWKWNTPVFNKNGIVLAIGVFKKTVKLNFFQGASLKDPNGLFNTGLEGNTMRSIDYYENDTFNPETLSELIQEAIAYRGEAT